MMITYLHGVDMIRLDRISHNQAAYKVQHINLGKSWRGFISHFTMLAIIN